MHGYVKRRRTFDDRLVDSSRKYVSRIPPILSRAQKTSSYVFRVRSGNGSAKNALDAGIFAVTNQSTRLPQVFTDNGTHVRRHDSEGTTHEEKRPHRSVVLARLETLDTTSSSLRFPHMVQHRPLINRVSSFCIWQRYFCVRRFRIRCILILYSFSIHNVTIVIYLTR